MTTEPAPSTEVAPVRDPMTGRLYPGAKLGGGGNPIAKMQYQHRRRFLDAVTPEELDKARAQLVADMFDESAKVRQAARAQYFDMVYGKATQTHEISRADDGSSSRSAMEDKMGRILDALADNPAARAKVADILLSGGEQPLEVIATVVTTEIVAEILPDGRID
jgi:hypothetical protein